MAKSQRDKGKRGEREACALIHSLTGREAKRSNQFVTGLHNPDIHVDSKCHFEVKFQERCSIYPYINQAREDAGISGSGRIPVVLYRSSKKPWLAIIEADKMVEFAKAIMEMIEGDKHENTNGSNQVRVSSSSSISDDELSSNPMLKE